MDIEEIASIIVDSAVKVHRALGPGLLESACQHCLAYELRKRGLRVDCEVVLRGQQIGCGQNRAVSFCKGDGR